MNTTILGLDKKKVEQLSAELNELLANFQIYYQNLRGLHWNIKGKSFFELHLKFEELYTDAQEKIDMVAERILTLEGKPLHTFEDYISNSTIKAVKNVHNADESIKIVLQNSMILLDNANKVNDIASESGDEGTVALISEIISSLEKQIWMLESSVE